MSNNARGRASDQKRSRENFLKDHITRSSALEDILSVLKIDAWDYVIVSDGSGQDWDKSCGWGSVLIEKSNFNRHVFHGNFSKGTNNMAEMMGFLQPLLWVASRDVKTDGTAVHVITDSQLIANCGNGKQRRGSNIELWCLFDSFRRKGIFTTFHWLPRSTIDLNRFADSLAGQSRLSTEGISDKAIERISEGQPIDFYGLNPSVE